MTQNTWPLPLGTDFADIMDAVDDMGANLVTNHANATAPTGADLHNRMWWYDETLDLMKLEDGAGGWLTIFSGAADGGLLPVDGTGEMTGDLDLNGSDIVLDADSDSKLLNDVDDEVGIQLAGAEEYRFTATQFEMNGNQILDCQNSANANTPSGATARQIEVYINGATHYVPAYSAAWT